MSKKNSGKDFPNKENLVQFLNLDDMFTRERVKA